MREPRQRCFGSLRSQKGPLQFKRCVPVGEEKGERKAAGVLPGVSILGTCICKVFKGWEFRDGFGEGSQWNSHQLFQVCPFRIMVSTDWSATGGGH